MGTVIFSTRTHILYIDLKLFWGRVATIVQRTSKSKSSNKLSRTTRWNKFPARLYHLRGLNTNTHMHHWMTHVNANHYGKLRNMRNSIGYITEQSFAPSQGFSPAFAVAVAFPELNSLLRLFVPVARVKGGTPRKERIVASVLPVQWPNDSPPLACTYCQWTFSERPCSMISVCRECLVRSAVDCSYRESGWDQKVELISPRDHSRVSRGTMTLQLQKICGPVDLMNVSKK